MSQAGLVDFEAANPQIPTTFNTDSGSAVPIANVLEIVGSTVANATNASPLFTKGSGNTVTAELQVGVAITGAPVDSNDAGLVSFDDTAFTVDANGYVTLTGGAGPAVDTNTGDDAVAVSASGAGNFNWIGLAVANATHAKPLFFKDSATANAIDLDVQVATEITGAPADMLDAGICSFDDTAFAVDANGYVTLAGGAGPAVDSFTTDVAGPALPTAGGVLDVTGTSVFSDGTVVNTLTLNVQATANTFLVGAGAGATATELGPMTNGQLIIGSTGLAPVLGSIASADGSVTITGGAGTIDLAVAAADDAILTLTGDSGGALSPTVGNMNVLGLSGSKVFGATSTLTVKSPPYADEGASATSVLNSGEFVTGAFTRTLPASAGLADGDLFEYVCTSSSALVIQAVTAQQIRVGTLITSAAGTLTSTAIGDSITLRFRATDGFFYATSVVGTWILA